MNVADAPEKGRDTGSPHEHGIERGVTVAMEEGTSGVAGSTIMEFT
ncbi:hypothetical protein [Phytomonospora endophytica]|uniref:Uncharacterized protein n=1 Tax=Phytomonospora endophytica TaxID=714109 RepID=A0A841FLR4_9ACTN|nr:hypothetical protein [Phytomonospora endophytica]MBB6034127.1 hypothetical protein [Phytomonospora endophytica]GIG66519.1 hypothetical protein Pen01_28140 [Phytomonospora endophytica]